MINTLLDPELDYDSICSMQPMNVEHSAVFIVNLGKLKSLKDIYCDDMGTWQYNGVYRAWLVVDDSGFVETLGRTKPSTITSNTYCITKKYFVHKSSGDLKKTVAMLCGKFYFLCRMSRQCICRHYHNDKGF